jgi:hypothetical protein
MAAMGGLLAMAAATAATVESGPERPVEVMVLGTYHFGNPGLDLHNVKAEDVTTPRRQAELQAVADAVAGYRPTRIMIETTPRDAGLVEPRFAAFTPASLTRERDEVVQIAFRIAHQLQLPKVYGIDEKGGPGEPDYFPFEKVAAFAGAHGQQARIDALMAKGAAITKATEEKQAQATIAELLVLHNEMDGNASSIDPYYEMLAIGDFEQQPGAELNAMWYLRNAKIFAKLIRLAEPGDRILVVYGSGHNYWLRHFAANTPGFRNVDPVPYLRRAVVR